MPASKTTEPSPRGRRAEKDAIALLAEDHAQIRRLLGQLEKTTGKAATRREKLLAATSRS